MSSRSSIFSFETLAERPAPTRAFLLALVLVVLARVALGVAGDRMLAIPGETADTRFFDVERRIRDLGMQPRVVLMGSSFAYYDLHEGVFAQAAGLAPEDVVNVAVNGGTPFEAECLIRRNPQLLQRADLVVVDLTRSMLNGNNRIRPLFYRLADLDHRLALDRLGDRLEAVVDLGLLNFREKRGIDQWVQGLVRLLRPERPEPPSPSPPRPLWAMTAEARLRSTANFQADVVAARQMTGFTESRMMRTFTDDFVRLCNERGVRLVVMVTPTADGFRDSFPKVPGAVRGNEAFFRWLDGLKDRATVLVFDSPASAGIPDEEFMDYGHLTEKGAAALTRALVRRLTECGLLPLK